MTKLFNSSISNQNLRYSKQTNRELVDSTRKLASGSRIVKASDDAAGLSIASKLNSQNRSKDQALRNTNDGFSILQIMDGSLNEINNMVIRMRELSIAAASDTYSDHERELMGLESNQLLNEIGRIAKSTEYMNQKVFTGSGLKFDIQVDTGGGNKNRISLDLTDMAQTPHALGIRDVKINTQLRARLSLAKIDYAQDQVLQSRAKVGALTNRLKSTVNKLGSDIENGKTAHSKIKDADYAKQTAEQVKAKLVQHSQTSIQTQLINTGRNYLKLLE